MRILQRLCRSNAVSEFAHGHPESLTEHFLRMILAGPAGPSADLGDAVVRGLELALERLQPTGDNGVDDGPSLKFPEAQVQQSAGCAEPPADIGDVDSLGRVLVDVFQGPLDKRNRPMRTDG